MMFLLIRIILQHIHNVLETELLEQENLIHQLECPETFSLRTEYKPDMFPQHVNDLRKLPGDICVKNIMSNLRHNKSNL